MINKKIHDIACIVVLYNPSNENIKNINIFSCYFDTVIVVDNSDENNKYEIDNKIIYVKNSKNLGLTEGINIGFRMAYKINFKWAIYFDQDTTINSLNFLNYCDLVNNIDNDVGMLTPLYEIERKRKPILHNELKVVTLTMTSASIFNLNIFMNIGMMDNRYFIDALDYDYCLRLKRNHYLVLQYNNYSVYHNPGITKCKYGVKYGFIGVNRFYYQIRNLCLLFHIYHYWKILFILCMKFIKVLLFFDNKKEYFKISRIAFLDYKNKKFGEKEN